MTGKPTDPLQIANMFSLCNNLESATVSRKCRVWHLICSKIKQVWPKIKDNEFSWTLRSHTPDDSSVPQISQPKQINTAFTRVYRLGIP